MVLEARLVIVPPPFGNVATCIKLLNPRPVDVPEMFCTVPVNLVDELVFVVAGVIDPMTVRSGSSLTFHVKV
jgi:hypothetical protein